MTTSTSIRTITRAHTAVHLSNAMVGAITEILSHVGIYTTASTIASEWGSRYDPAIRAWINEGSLKQVVVECHRPDGTTDPVLEFPIDYSNDGSAGLSDRHVALARQWAKMNAVPAGTSVKIICDFNGPRTPQPGWSSTTLASTAGLRSTTLGTLAGGPYATASVRLRSAS